MNKGKIFIRLEGVEFVNVEFLFFHCKMDFMHDKKDFFEINATFVSKGSFCDKCSFCKKKKMYAVLLAKIVLGAPLMSFFTIKEIYSSFSI